MTQENKDDLCNIKIAKSFIKIVPVQTYIKDCNDTTILKLHDFEEKMV